jgi:hypothetical protein
MISYNRYFDEWDMPPSGIDTISIWINPLLINRFEDFYERGNIHEAINLRRFTETTRQGQSIRTNYLIDIQAEVINPDSDILEQVLGYLSSLVYYGTLKPMHNADMVTTTNFFRTSFSSLFSIDCLDFYFDLKAGDVNPLGVPDPKHPNTYYSKDYPSSLKTYSRVERLKHKNHISYSLIEKMEYHERIEFHLARGNCDYLDCRNLQGTYELVFLRYLPQLARKWYDHRRTVVKVPNLRGLPYAHHLRQIDEVAYQGRIPHYRDLLKTPRKPTPFKHAKKNEVDMNWLPAFSTRP